ncbi:MAG: hypothetical protein A2901_07455 [Elusimicrobia bacterium RIFCSPLOWO2_01_FULL_54_10]|nr:MAG: hypothetical protein A2901_07455 [Elusimicrobia bacterium RIFCSPLOWO2_01_FULL_54_10]
MKFRTVILIFSGFFLQGCAGQYPLRQGAAPDITTDPYNPPQFVTLEKMLYPIKNIEIQQQQCPDILPVKSKFSSAQTFELCKKAGLSMLGWALVHENLMTFTLEFAARTSAIFSKDDVVIVVSEEKTGSSVHVRSKSRSKTGDWEGNAERIRKFFLKFREAEAGHHGVRSPKETAR